MAEKQASWIQASSHPADTDRLVLEGLLNPAGNPVSGAAWGIGSGSTELQVTQNGTPNMSVNVAAGHAWIDGTESPTQGTYHVYNDAVKNLAISAAHATLARKDLIVARVQDAQYSGATNAWTLAVVTGTPAGSPAEPVVPANAIVLALVDVAAAASSITNANITDRRRRASALGGITVCTSGTRPATPYVGQLVYETDKSRVSVWDGTLWYPVTNGPACRVFYSTTQAIPDASETTVAFDSERYDADGMHDPAVNSGRITFSIPGVYRVGFQAEMVAAGDYALVVLVLRVNGTLNIAISDNYGGTSGNRRQVSTEWKFAAGDYVEARVYQDNTANVARNLVYSGGNSPEFMASWVGRG